MLCYLLFSAGGPGHTTSNIKHFIILFIRLLKTAKNCLVAVTRVEGGLEREQYFQAAISVRDHDGNE